MKLSGINTYEITIPEGAKVGETLQKFEKEEVVEFAESNFLAQALFTPNDPLYSNQWGLKKINATQAWDESQGGAGPVAVIDTGVSASHPDLKGQVLAGYNFVSDNTNTNDDHGHGTHVSGIVSAVTNNSLGVSSIGFKGTILPVKVLSSSGSGTYSDVASGIVYAADHGAKIINLSLGGPSYSQTLQNAVTYAVNKGSFVIAAAGNSGSSTPLYPAACKGALAITASDSSDNLASFSSYGQNAFVAAPGVNITSTYPGDTYKGMSGTSMATPHVAGLFELAYAYMSSTEKSFTNQQFLDLIGKSAEDVGSYPYNSDGWNQYFGYGRINAYKLIEEIRGPVTESPTPTPSPSKTPTIAPSAEPSKTESPKPKLTFNVVAGGEIDSINKDEEIIKIKIFTISQKMKLNPDNYVDLYIEDETDLKLKGKNISFEDLSVGDRLSAKALWAEDKLTATSIYVQSKAKSGDSASDDSSSGSKKPKGKK